MIFVFVYLSIFGGHNQILSFWKFVFVLGKHLKFDSPVGFYSDFLFRIKYLQTWKAARLKSWVPVTAGLKCLVMPFLQNTHYQSK